MAFQGMLETLIKPVFPQLFGDLDPHLVRRWIVTRHTLTLSISTHPETYIGRKIGLLDSEGLG
jgi:hypothetical protein